ncbi:hypothetical protein [Aurantimonas coralicida]|uniref:hypothetical protein n=1 Tax=Aurantimonas coralicida TaxID=182270 RepID=UPI001D189A24|nr:hypothetical protein [Aurantimonas coralicida]MCC4298421.1 hypothetical protein [Aurantimonas coralicida]
MTTALDRICGQLRIYENADRLPDGRQLLFAGLRLAEGAIHAAMFVDVVIHDKRRRKMQLWTGAFVDRKILVPLANDSLAEEWVKNNREIQSRFAEARVAVRRATGRRQISRLQFDTEGLFYLASLVEIPESV